MADNRDNHMGPMPVPPGIVPKLPEPEPAPQKRNLAAFARREVLVAGAAVVVLLALGVWFIVFALGAARTPAQTVGQSAGEGAVVQEALMQVSLPGDEARSVFFYTTENGLTCALLQRSASGYKLVDTFGRLSLTGTGEGDWSVSSLSGGEKEIFLFGIFYDNSLFEVEVNGEAAVVVDDGQYRLWYYIAEGDVSINNNSVVYS